MSYFCFAKNLITHSSPSQEWHKYEAPSLCVSIAKSLTCLLSIAETCDMSPYALRAWDNYLPTTIISVFAALAQQLLLVKTWLASNKDMVIVCLKLINSEVQGLRATRKWQYKYCALNRTIGPTASSQNKGDQ